MSIRNSFLQMIGSLTRHSQETDNSSRTAPPSEASVSVTTMNPRQVPVRPPVIEEEQIENRPGGLLTIISGSDYYTQYEESHEILYLPDRRFSGPDHRLSLQELRRSSAPFMSDDFGNLWILCPTKNFYASCDIIQGQPCYLKSLLILKQDRTTLEISDIHKVLSLITGITLEPECARIDAAMHSNKYISHAINYFT
jgi:hypothetical protein